MQSPASKPKPAEKGSTDPLIGKTIGGCRIESLLGRGAMGAVYKARQVNLDRDVAVKVIRPEMMTDPRMLKRFEVEARTVGKFNSPHVVMVHDVGFAQGVHFLVMEFVQGKNMREHCKLLAGGRLPAGEAIPLLRQACKGLEEAQRLSVIHRDIKPDNLMLTDRGVLKIADFGIAKPIQEDFNMTMTSELIGTPLYMSPEQCQGSADLDFRSDMYSLGATFYYLLTGEPPIRASSVYELIQTKTKLENLCLWKALAELDENHPLSRVIERMTSLDREDRYESYEALFNDIVLVEQGGTVEIPAKGLSRARRARAKAAQKKRRNLLIAALVLVMAGGGYAASLSWGGGGGNSIVDASSLPQRLEALGKRLANNGPDDNLLKDVEALPDLPNIRLDRQRLLDDVNTGLRVKAQLAELQLPTSLTPPFEELKAYYASVGKVTLNVDAAGKHLVAWWDKARVAARAESTLGPNARASLLGAFTTWQADRSTAGGDEVKLAALRKRLDVIGEGRRTLEVQIPTQKVPLDQALPIGTLIAAEKALANKDQPVADVDVSQVLTQLHQSLENNGPNLALEENLKRVVPTRDDQKKTKEALLTALGVATGVANRIEEFRAEFKSENPELPFDTIETYYLKIEKGLEPLRPEGVDLPRWAQTLRTTVRDEKRLQAQVVGACKSAWSRWTREQSSSDGTDDLEADLRKLERGVAKAVVLFPDCKAELERAIPATVLAEAQTRLERSKKKQTWLGNAKKLLGQLGTFTQLADWRAGAEQCNKDLESLRATAADVAAEPEVKRDLNRATQIIERWTGADKAVAAVANAIAAGDLTSAEAAARSGVSGDEGKDELKQIGEAAVKCHDAFKLLDKELDVDRALTLLAEARAFMKSNASLAPKADERIKRWCDRVEALKLAAAGMVKIEAGSTKVSAQQVPAFFLSPTECSFGDFQKFLRELRAAVNGIDERGAKLRAIAPRLAGAEMNEEQLQALLERDLRKQPDKTPIDRVNYYVASAYCAWNGFVLPTAAEWALAAFGNGNRVQYSWGPEWSNDPQHRNTNNKALAEVDAGGLSWRTSEGKRIHHITGNVAEWLAAEQGAASAQQAGGRYNDSDSKAREQAGGQMATTEKTDDRLGIGFRTALRPRTFIGQLWPR
ncbi:MAG TPA: protein kinase [Planctomycetota bacterium]